MTTQKSQGEPLASACPAPEPISLIDIATVLASGRRWLIGLPLLAGVLALGATFLVKPVYTAKTVFLPPQQQQSAAASALASLGGALSGLAGGMAGGLKTPGDQYVSLLQSRNVSDRLIDRFKLKEVYGEDMLFKVREELDRNVRIGLGKKDNMITVEVDATDPQMAADMANQYVAELRRLSDELALSEAQQRRLLFEGELKRTRTKLADAQLALQNSGFNPGALKAEPKAAAEGYARLKAELTTSEVRLQALRRRLTDDAPEVQQQIAMQGALRSELGKLSDTDKPANEADYIGRYREYKYQETLFDMFAKQYELARLDETREGALIQVVDPATKPEWKSRPKRAVIAALAGAATFLIVMVTLLLRQSFRNAAKLPETARKLERLRQSLTR